MEFGFLDRLLASLEVSVQAFAVCKLAKGWSLALEGTPSPLLHYVLQGSGALRFENGDRVSFCRNDFIVVPAGRKHWLESPEGSLQEVRAAEQCATLVGGMLSIQATGDQPPATITICGALEATYAGSLGFFAGLAGPLVLQLSPGDRIRQAIEASIEELATPRLGSHALAEALLKQCLILLVRRFAEEPERAPWLFVAADPRLLRTAIAMIENPASEYSLDKLAQSAGMSRSTFAAQFHGSFGQPPIEFLKKLRLHRAAGLLERTNIPVSLIARSIGYESRTYFSRAFREQFGIGPRRFRADKRR